MRNSGRLFTLLGTLLAAANVTTAQTTTTIFFDGTGAEAGITTPGTTDFSFMRSNWSGGVVSTEFITPLYASGDFSYEIDVMGGVVTFDDPVDSVDFFFVHGFGFSAGTATAFDGSGTPIGSVNSNAATVFAAPSNFVMLDPSEPIARIEFSGAVIDNFSYTISPLPPTVPAVSEWGMGIMLLFVVASATLILRKRCSCCIDARRPMA